MKGRLDYLDGLRGIAALAVVFEHMSTLLPTIGTWHVGHGVGGELASAAINFPFRSGKFAVYVFFAISGMVIASAASRRRPLAPTIVARYLRLTLPMLVASLLAWGWLHLFPNFMPKMAQFRPNHWTDTIYQEGAPSLARAFKEPLFQVYLGDKPYLNPALWSMHVELWGSLGIYAFYALGLDRFRIRLLAVAAIALAVFGQEQFVSFPLGAILYETVWRFPPRQNSYWAVAAALSSLACGITAETSIGRYIGTVASTKIHLPIDSAVLLNVAGGALALLCLLKGWQARELTRWPPVHFLGRVSFGLYLGHIPMLFTAFAALAFWIGPSAPLWMLIAWPSVFIVAAFALAWGLTVAVDQPAMSLSRWIGRLNISRRLADAA